jgi:hypothetical protein
MTAQANFTSSKPRFRQKCYDRSSANLVRLNSARNIYRSFFRAVNYINAFFRKFIIVITEVTYSTSRIRKDIIRSVFKRLKSVAGKVQLGRVAILGNT